MIDGIGQVGGVSAGIGYTIGMKRWHFSLARLLDAWRAVGVVITATGVISALIEAAEPKEAVAIIVAGLLFILAGTWEREDHE